MAVEQTEQHFDKIIKITEGNSVVTDGPLSVMYADALNEIYAKEIDPATGISIESQANDALSSRNYWLATKIATTNFANTGQDVGMLYGVSKRSAGLSDVLRVSDALSEMTKEQKENSALVLDTVVVQDNANAPIEVQTNVQVIPDNVFTVTLENLCLKHSVKVYSSLKDYLSILKRK